MIFFHVEMNGKSYDSGKETEIFVCGSETA